MQTVWSPAHIDVRSDRHDAVVVVLGGEIDVRSAPEIRSALQAVIDAAPSSIVFDLRDVSRLDVAGLAAVTAAAMRSRRASIEIMIVPPTAPAPRKLINRVGVVPILNRVVG